ncbi:MAG TPA: T9SS type A sorting domain-containing protein, partial [Mariniphaga sp.]|nr:T9SS type A sorting domain-containing protein [Mariniphaga sp.]
LDSIVTQTFEADTEDWTNGIKTHYLYEDNLTNTAQYTYIWIDTTNTWEETSHMEFSYDEEGLLTEILTYEPDETSGEVVLQLKSEAQYSNENRLDTIIQYYTEDQENWIEAGKIGYQYNDAGQLVQMSSTSLIEDEGEEILVTFEIEYSYDENERLEAYSMKMITEGIELTMLEADLLYDDSGKRIASEISAFNILSSTMEKAERSEYEYNELDELIVDYQYIWDDEQEDWILDMKDEIDYNELMISDVVLINYELFLGEIVESISSQHAIAEVTTYVAEEDNWNFYEKSTYYYTEGTSTYVDIVDDNSISIYPNPFTDQITLSWQGHAHLSLELYSLNGQKIIDRMITPGHEVKVSHLKNGVYLYQIRNNNKLLKSGKILKK